jgi:hypothetical protein
MNSPSSSPWFDHPYIWWVQIMKHPITQFSPNPWHLLPLSCTLFSHALSFCSSLTYTRSRNSSGNNETCYELDVRGSIPGSSQVCSGTHKRPVKWRSGALPSKESGCWEYVELYLHPICLHGVILSICMHRCVTRSFALACSTLVAVISTAHQLSAIRYHELCSRGSPHNPRPASPHRGSASLSVHCSVGKGKISADSSASLPRTQTETTALCNSSVISVHRLAYIRVPGLIRQQPDCVRGEHTLRFVLN